MQTLIIGTPELQAELVKTIGNPSDVTWVHELGCAFTHLEVSDIDTIIFDIRSKPFESPEDLKDLIARVPVTTRVLAIVEHLPEDDLFSECGVVYLTPPVNLQDIIWFIRQP